MTAVLIDQPTSAYPAQQYAATRRTAAGATLSGALVAFGGAQIGIDALVGTKPADAMDVSTPAHLRNDLPCQTHEADLWFSDTPIGLEEAKLRCAPCPLRSECLAGALARREPWGVWGGEIFERGVVIGRKRPRGRPRKEAA